jgi:hypothetical protein
MCLISDIQESRHRFKGQMLAVDYYTNDSGGPKTIWAAITSVTAKCAYSYTNASAEGAAALHLFCSL